MRKGMKGSLHVWVRSKSGSFWKASGSSAGSFNEEQLHLNGLRLNAALAESVYFEKSVNSNWQSLTLPLLAPWDDAATKQYSHIIHGVSFMLIFTCIWGWRILSNPQAEHDHWLLGQQILSSEWTALWRSSWTLGWGEFTSNCQNIHVTTGFSFSKMCTERILSTGFSEVFEGAAGTIQNSAHPLRTIFLHETTSQ